MLIKTKLVIIAAALLGFASSAMPAPAFAADATIGIENFTFSPQTLTVKAGTTVTWTNKDDIPHTVVSTASAFKSKALDTDDKFTFTFTTPGVYDYFCSIHPHMKASIIVEAATGENVSK
jgi:plastocyanin